MNKKMLVPNTIWSWEYMDIVVNEFRLEDGSFKFKAFDPSKKTYFAQQGLLIGTESSEADIKTKIENYFGNKK